MADHTAGPKRKSWGYIYIFLIAQGKRGTQKVEVNYLGRALRDLMMHRQAWKGRDVKPLTWRERWSNGWNALRPPFTQHPQ